MGKKWTKLPNVENRCLEGDAIVLSFAFTSHLTPSASNMERSFNRAKARWIIRSWALKEAV